MDVSCMRNASDHNYMNSSVIVDLVMGQIPYVPQNVFLVFVLFNHYYFIVFLAVVSGSEIDS